MQKFLAGTVATLAALAFLSPAATASAAPPQASSGAVVASKGAVPKGAIKHVLVIDLENEGYDTSFGDESPARYLNDVLVPQGQLLTNYYGVGHFSTDNYLAQISGQAPNKVSGNDCITNSQTFTSTYTDVLPGTPTTDQATYPGQVDGSGCVYPANVQTIGDQLDALPGASNASGGFTWRQYAEDMGNTPARDFGTTDPWGGTSCAHPPTDGVFPNSATTTDQYAIRHVPFLFFHSVTDRQAYCDEHVVPLGTLTTDASGKDVFAGHLAQDLAQARTTPAFAMVTPNVCNDGHDATCTGVNAEGTHIGGLAGADLWLKHWMPLILNSPAYTSGQMLVVLTFDESDITDAAACCNEQPGPDNANPGFPPLAEQFLGLPAPTAPGQYPGGGRTGAVLLNAKWIQPGSINGTPYNHYSALRSYEDLLGITRGGADGKGHLGFAGQVGLTSFGADVFNVRTTKG